MTLRKAWRVHLLVATTVVSAAVATAWVWDAPPGIHFWFWLAACFGGELLWVRLPVGQATVSMASCFQFATLLLLPQGQAMAAVAVSGMAAELLVIRKSPVRAIFNAGQSALAVGAAAWCFTALGGGSRGVNQMLYGLDIMPLVAAAAAYFVINTGTVSLAVSLHEGVSFRQAWSANLGHRYHLLAFWALFSLGALVASHYAFNGIAGTLLVALPLMVAHEGYRRSLSPQLEHPSAVESERAAA